MIHDKLNLVSDLGSMTRPVGGMLQIAKKKIECPFLWIYSIFWQHLAPLTCLTRK